MLPLAKRAISSVASSTSRPGASMHHRGQFSDRSIEVKRNVDGVREQISRRPHSGVTLLVTPSVRLGGIISRLIEIKCAIVKSLSDTPFCNELFRKNDRRNATKVKPNHIRPALHCFRHTLRLLKGRGQRLFTEHDLPCFGSRNCDYRVQRVWNGDIDSINVFSGDDFPPVRLDLAPTPPRSRRFQLCAVAAADDLKANIIRSVEEMGHLAKGV